MRRRCVACITAKGGHTKYWILKSRVSCFNHKVTSQKRNCVSNLLRSCCVSYRL
jgi:hypothetical protein